MRMAPGDWISGAASGSLESRKFHQLPDLIIGGADKQFTVND